MKTGEREPGSKRSALDDSPDALDRLLAEIRVPVDPAFSRQVMSRLPDADWRPTAIGCAASGRSPRRWSPCSPPSPPCSSAAAMARGAGVGTSIVDLVVTTVAAGAGFLAASWRGLGTMVDAALDGSVTALLALGLAALAANGLLLLLLRRRRSAVRSNNDS